MAITVLQARRDDTLSNWILAEGFPKTGAPGTGTGDPIQAGDTLLMLTFRTSPLAEITVDGVVVTPEVVVSAQADGSGRTGYLEIYKHVLTGDEEAGDAEDPWGFFVVSIEQETSGPIAMRTLLLRSDAPLVFGTETAALSDHTADREITIPTVSKISSASLMIGGAGCTHTPASGSYTDDTTVPFEASITDTGALSIKFDMLGYWEPSSVVETTSGSFTFPDSGTGSIGLMSYAVVTSEVSLDVDHTENLGISEEVTLLAENEDTLSDTIASSDLLAPGRRFARIAEDTSTIVGVSFMALRASFSAMAEIGITDATIQTDAFTLVDTILGTESYAAGSVFGTSTGDMAAMLDRMSLGVPQALAENVGVAEAVASVVALNVIERVGLTRSLLNSAVFPRGLQQDFTVSDSVRQFFSGELLDAVGMTTSLVEAARFGDTSADSLGLSDTETTTMVLRVTAASTMTISPQMALQMLYRPELSEAVEIAAAFVSPGDGITTWAVNARTGAVSEYENFEFNSFAPHGTRYLGASATGLYALDGDDDDGKSIIGSLKSGFMQFAGSRFSGFRAAYIGVRGPGQYAFKLETSDGKTYTYGVDVRRMETTKINLGKGIRASYFAFELTSEGQDFDIDFVEFVPARANRRV